MDTNSNKYTFVYAIILVVVVATILTLVAVNLQPLQQKNIELEKKKNILAAFNVKSTPENVESLYDKFIVESFAVNSEGEKNTEIDAFNIKLKDELKKDSSQRQMPVYIAKTEKGETKYIFPLYGKGLWGPIWGYIALNEDFTHVYGVYFDHKTETPGLGAEIATEDFQKQFVNKAIFNNLNEFVSIDVVKTGANGDLHAVDAISGGTITSYGLRDMLKTCLNSYIKYIEKNKN